MTQGLDPIGTSDAIKKTYQRYLSNLLPLKDDDLVSGIRQAVERHGVTSRGPLLEATPPFRQGATLQELVDEGVLTSTFARLFSQHLPGHRPLHLHQEQSIRKAAAGRNLVIATGTGSGKTESFLVPVLDSLMREHETEGLGPGVRAILLYPMNALANDQLKRLRQLLAAVPEITFGRYTGDTLADPSKARDAFVAQTGNNPLPNELLSREEMQQAPPHLLLTNYAMLEYLLLRPADMSLFEGDHAGTWSHVIVDEAHVYDGIKGAEIAMLLRRLRRRVLPQGQLQCLASSATVGDDPDAVAAFGRGLFGTQFEWVDDDPSRQDVVRASRLEVPQASGWGPLPPQQYRELVRDPEPATWAERNELPPVANEATMLSLQRRLARGPQDVSELATALYPDLPPHEAEVATATLVLAGHRVLDPRSGAPTLSARYHLFMSAVEGAFTCLGPHGPHLHLSRHEECPTCGDPAFELAACKRCGQVHLPGRLARRGQHTLFAPRRHPADSTHWLVVGDFSLLDDEDDDINVTDGGKSLGLEKAVLCTACSCLTDVPVSACPSCHERDGLRTVTRIDAGHELKQCGSCGGRSARQIRRFASGADATAAVLASSLYEQLPADPSVHHPGEGRRLLLFSDSRQQAAFAAPYLQITYNELLQRRLVMMALERMPDEQFASGDVTVSVRQEANRHGAFAEYESGLAQRRQVATWVHRELIDGDERQGLEGTGLVRVALVRPAAPPPRPLLDLGLAEDEAWDLLEELVHTLRYQGAVSPVDDLVDFADPILEPRNRAVFVRKDGSDAKRSVLSWRPSGAARRNRRTDLMERVLERLGPVDVTSGDLLAGIWDFLTSERGPGWLVREPDRRLGVVYRVDSESIRWQRASALMPMWSCSVCRRQTPRSVRGVCPTNGCRGSLTPVAQNADDNHYSVLYRTMPVRPLRAEEHTAQLSNDLASEIQQDFLEGRVNVLSCSTTFELGVDVGELQSVLLRNVPPSTANYVQRAGRAGRRTDSAALVVTFAQMRSHDQGMFARPEAMIKGTVRAPVVVDDNVRVDRRHAHSVVLSAFLREQAVNRRRQYRTAQDFFRPTGGESTGLHELRSYLDPPPSHVLDDLEAVLPADVAAAIDVRSQAWITELMALLDGASDEYLADRRFFENAQADAVGEQKFKQAEAIKKVLNNINSQQLLAYLARRNVLPKYGFPVDTVELRVSRDADRVAAQLDLSRDLTVAINEYAPGSAIVARGKVIRSAGVYRFPQRDLVVRNYGLCSQCDHLEVSNEPLGGSCPECGSNRSGVRTTFVKPEFGFVAARTVDRVRATRPVSRWLSRLHVLDTGEEQAGGSANTPLGVVTWRVCVRATLCVLNEGPNRSRYAICDWCGDGVPGHEQAGPKARRKPHVRPLTGRECEGTRTRHALAHDYQTDALFIRVPNLATTEQARSLLYAILAGAADALEIARDDIDGTILVARSNEIALFDTVPAGAGLVRRIAEHLDEVLAAAHRRVAECDCGQETSCYRCLRVYRNQAFHEDLRRDHVLTLFSSKPAAVEVGETELPAGFRSATSVSELIDGARAVVIGPDGRHIGTVYLEKDGDAVVTVGIADGGEVVWGPASDWVVVGVETVGE